MLKVIEITKVYENRVNALNDCAKKYNQNIEMLVIVSKPLRTFVYYLSIEKIARN